MKILIFGGTTEGIGIANFLYERGYTIVYSGAYNHSFSEKINCIWGKMDFGEMLSFIKENNFDTVIDATHPFAVNVSKNIELCNKELSFKLYKIKRKNMYFKNALYFDTYDEICDFLRDKQENFLITTGIKNLHKYAQIPNFSKYAYLRILPNALSLERAISLGYDYKKINCYYGVAGEEYNSVLIKEFNLKYIISKDSGISGGVEEKYNACEKNNITLILLKEPVNSEGLTEEEIKNIFR